MSHNAQIVQLFKIWSHMITGLLGPYFTDVSVSGL